MEIPDTLLAKKIYVPDDSQPYCTEKDCGCRKFDDGHLFDLPGRRMTLGQFVQAVADHHEFEADV